MDHKQTKTRKALLIKAQPTQDLRNAARLSF